MPKSVKTKKGAAAIYKVVVEYYFHPSDGCQAFWRLLENVQGSGKTGA